MNQMFPFADWINFPTLYIDGVQMLILDMSGYDLDNTREKWLNYMYLQTVETLIRRRVLRRLIWVCTVCHFPSWRWGGVGVSTLKRVGHILQRVTWRLANQRLNGVLLPATDFTGLPIKVSMVVMKEVTRPPRNAAANLPIIPRCIISGEWILKASTRWRKYWSMIEVRLKILWKMIHLS